MAEEEERVRDCGCEVMTWWDYSSSFGGGEMEVEVRHGCCQERRECEYQSVES